MQRIFKFINLCNVQTRLRIWVVLLFLLWLCGASMLWENYRHNIWQDDQIKSLAETDIKLRQQITTLEAQCLLSTPTAKTINQ